MSDSIETRITEVLRKHFRLELDEKHTAAAAEITAALGLTEETANYRRGVPFPERRWVSGWEERTE